MGSLLQSRKEKKKKKTYPKVDCYWRNNQHRWVGLSPDAAPTHPLSPLPPSPSLSLSSFLLQLLTIIQLNPRWSPCTFVSIKSCNKKESRACVSSSSPLRDSLPTYIVISFDDFQRKKITEKTATSSSGKRKTAKCATELLLLMREIKMEGLC